MTYGEAISVLHRATQEAIDAPVMLEAIDKILSMTTINAVSKDLLLTAVRFLMGYASELTAKQEPRMMTLEEVKAFDWDYCYLEEERLPGKEYRSVCGDYALTCITWPYVAHVTSMRILHGDDKYSKKWRCWTSKPTDEQREAVKWDD